MRLNVDKFYIIVFKMLIIRTQKNFNHNQALQKSQTYQMKQISRAKPQQLIDAGKKINLNAIESLGQELANVEKQYMIVAIIGVQNSGKSTLLNNLFGTNFQVLQKPMGERTTLGVWTSLDKEAPIIILDVQGNDANERAHETEYEKMISTFALVQADTLIINVWSKTLGQYTGSQYQTLKTVLQICLSQFKQQSPKTLLFCIRDFDSEEQDEGQIRRRIIKDVNNVWLKIQKPPQISQCQTTEKFFNIEVAVLRSLLMANGKYFIEDANKLRQRFINPKSEGYVFKSKKTSFNLPLKDLSDLIQNSWNSIITNKKLNLPNQKEQISNARCAEVSKELLDAFKVDMDKIELNKRATDFGKILSNYTKQFQEKTYNYSRHYVEEYENKFKQQLNDTIVRVINELIDWQQKRIKEQFRKILSYLNQQNSEHLQGELNDLKNQSIQQFSDILRSYNFQIGQRKQKIQTLKLFLQNQNRQMLVKMKDIIDAQFEKQWSREMRLLSSEILKEHFGFELWAKTEKLYELKKSKIMESYKKKINWIQKRVLEPSQIDAIDQSMSSLLKNTIRQYLKNNLMSKAFDVFIRQFTKNKEGVPYNFNILQIKKIGDLYDRARDNARELVSVINICNVKRSNASIILDFQDNEKDQFFDSKWLSNALNDLDKKMIAEHETIVRKKVLIDKELETVRNEAGANMAYFDDHLLCLR